MVAAYRTTGEPLNPVVALEAGMVLGLQAYRLARIGHRPLEPKPERGA